MEIIQNDANPNAVIKLYKEGYQMLLDTIYYTVNRLDGDYAYLQKEDDPQVELKCVARALLPAEIVEGSRLLYEMMEYRIIDTEER